MKLASHQVITPPMLAGIFAILAVAGIGSFLVFNSKASTPTASIQAESGTVTGIASSLTDASASSGKAIQFGTGNSPGGGMSLVWNDEFNGSSVDTSKWNVRTQANGYDEVYNLPANVTEGGGNLTIVGKRQPTNGKPYTAGYIDTIGKKGFRYGKFEMRAKLPQAKGTSKGIWPAWWLRSDDAGGEIDIMEAWGDPGNYTGNAAQDTYGRVLGTAFANTNAPSDGKTSGWSGAVGSLVLGDWHTYSVIWTPTGITWYVDDKPYRSATVAQYPWLASSFPTTVNLRLNLQISQNYNGYADSSTVLPVDYVVDYVRIYQ